MTPRRLAALIFLAALVCPAAANAEILRYHKPFKVAPQIQAQHEGSDPDASPVDAARPLVRTCGLAPGADAQGIADWWDTPPAGCTSPPYVLKLPALRGASHDLTPGVCPTAALDISSLRSGAEAALRLIDERCLARQGGPSQVIIAGPSIVTGAGACSVIGEIGRQC